MNAPVPDRRDRRAPGGSPPGATAWSYAGRFVLPLVLLLAAVGSWAVADRLGNVPRAQAPPATSDDVPAVPLLSIRRLPEFAGANARAAAIAEAVAALPSDPGGLSCAAIMVDGRLVYDLRADQPLVPSYAQLLITAHAAIDVLGPEFRFRTQLLAATLPDADGRIYDAVYLDGGGDPVMESYEYSIGFRPVHTTRTALDDLADAAVAAGLARVDGGVIAIERRYDQERYPPGASPELIESGALGPLSALQLDDGYAVRAASNLGVAVPAEDPAAFAASRFADRLAERDVATFASSRTMGPDEPLPTLVVIATLDSPPLADIVFQVLAVNDGTAAEMLVKELGYAADGNGSTQAGGRVIQRVLQDQGVELDVPFRDGSGLDPFGGTTCGQLVAAADAIPDDHATLQVLPAYDLPGVFDGQLADVELETDLRLVGGVEGDAGGLVGRTVDAGPRVTIATIVNRPGGPTPNDIAWQQSLVGLVDGLRQAGNLGVAIDD